MENGQQIAGEGNMSDMLLSGKTGSDARKAGNDAGKTGNDAANEYQRAAQRMRDYVSEAGFEMPWDTGMIEKSLGEFSARFAPEKLAALPEEEVLEAIFYSVGENDHSLCYWLEKNGDCRKYFGSVAGGSAYKFGLFQKQSTGEWMTGSPQKPQRLDEDEALAFGGQIRDALVKGAGILKSAVLGNLSDYEKLDDALRAGMGEPIFNWGWVHKYLCMVCPDKLSGFHSSDWQRHVLYALGIRPSERYYARSGQLAMTENAAGWNYFEFISVIREKFGAVKQFVRLGTSDHAKNYGAEWGRRSVAGIGWGAIGSLRDYAVGDGLDRGAIAESLRRNYYPLDERTASRKAGELARFYKADGDTVFVAMDGERLLAFVDGIGEYFYDASSDMPHLKPGKWHHKFSEGGRLPVNSEGKQASCYPLADSENLLYLYEAYYYGREESGERAGDPLGADAARKDAAGRDATRNAVAREGAAGRGVAGNAVTEETAAGAEIMGGDDRMDVILPEYHTGFESDYERNRIVFGAPGTGKSFKLKQEAEDLIGCARGHMERVTFHPDYSYAQFAGAYKPVSDADGRIRYDFVPGPFMRMYVNAVQNIRQMERTRRLMERAEVMHLFPTNPNPANGEEKWDLFEEVKEAGQMETFRASRDSRVGDLALIYVAKTKPGYDNGIYAIGTIAEKQGEDVAAIRFEYVSYCHPIIDYNTLKEYSPNIRSKGRVSEEIAALVRNARLPANPFLLIIEEINRAKAAAVFGDVFQLLDRDEHGVSEYGIHASEDVRRYLASRLSGRADDWTEIKLPDNLFIWATMNSADQGVFPMDTAFKRRWDFEYLGINENEEEIRGTVTLGANAAREVEWNLLRRAINDKLSKECRVNEDKLMGPFFLSGKALWTVSEEDDSIADAGRFKEAFKSKVIMYLYEDAARQYRHRLFSGCEEAARYSAVCDSFDEKGILIFGDDFEDLYYNPQKG